MKTVVVGSTNPVKLEATKAAFAAVFPNDTFEFKTCAAVSGVPDQPFGSDETKTGSENRARHSTELIPGADYYVGLEGGLEKVDDEHWVFAWMCVLSKDGLRGYGKSGSFKVPPKMSAFINAGHELGDATDLVFNETNSKHKEGTIGILTKGSISRKDFYVEAMIFALIPFANPGLYQIDCND